ncbi:ubiquitin-conjugating enzyme/RWD-like protein [Hyaloraphidium curvatum]|nr:ubiquitin-conjugating enzyme/RWD-like protein [Hyaloraphidium curvatum]
MLNIMSLKKQKAAAAEAGPKKAKTSAAQIRLQKDFSDMDKLPRTMKLTFPDPNDLFKFTLIISPDEGFYKGGTFNFDFNVNTNYPHEPPKVKCMQKIYHPNIDLEGNVCLNILREDWKPVLNINSIIVGLQYLFLEPNADDPLNKDAAEVLRTNRRQFETNVTRSMRGGSINGIYFDVVAK